MLNPFNAAKDNQTVKHTMRPPFIHSFATKRFASPSPDCRHGRQRKRSRVHFNDTLAFLHLIIVFSFPIIIIVSSSRCGSSTRSCNPTTLLIHHHPPLHQLLFERALVRTNAILHSLYNSGWRDGVGAGLLSPLLNRDDSQ